MDMIARKKRIMMDQPHLVDASGNPISFNTDMAAKMGVKAHFSPVQAGMGDPSPSNVRPITGWTGCTVSHSGADTSNPTTYPVTFPAEAGTLYGGYVDYERGEVVAEWAFLDSTWSEGSNPAVGNDNTRKKFVMPRQCISAEGSVGGKRLCNIATWWWDIATTSVHYYVDGTNAYVFLPNDTSGSTKIQIAAKLATPIHYPITPTLIKSLKGANTIWSDMNGNLDISYWKH